jgi:hypothetical protein
MPDRQRIPPIFIAGQPPEPFRRSFFVFPAPQAQMKAFASRARIVDMKMILNSTIPAPTRATPTCCARSVCLSDGWDILKQAKTEYAKPQ